MISQVFKKQIVCGVISALGLSGSVYFVVKQTTPSEPITSVTVAPPTSNKTIDLTDHISKAKDIGIEDIDVMFEILNRMQENGIVPTIQQLIEHKDKWKMLAELLKDCFPTKDSSGVVDKSSIRQECKTPTTEKDKKEFLDMFLNMGDQIKKLMDENKKDMDQKKPAVEQLTVFKAVEQLMNAKSLSKSPHKDSQANVFLEKFKALVTSKATESSTTADAQLISDLDALIAVHSQLAAVTNPGGGTT